VAASVLDGWEMIQETEYDLIFVDLNIPEISGFELIEKLSQDENTKAIPVVVISALPEDGLIDEVLSAGAQLFLEKPVALVDLFSVIEKFETKSSK
jgi:putative two-component system response regulator